MLETRYENYETAWCPGCGNHVILEVLTGVLESLDIPQRNILLMGGIGQAPKLHQYISANGFMGLHGRALPAAVAAKMANETLTVIVDTGDGDSYGEGGNHFLHNIRRNVDIAHFVHDNQIYGLTKGQPSPTSDACPAGKNTGRCNMGAPFNPLLVALAAGATFVARGFTGRKEHLADMMRRAIAHKGYALLDILQPCVSFNKVNTFAWYNARVRELPPDYAPADRLRAMEACMEFGETIPIGVLYEAEAPTYHAARPALYNGTPLIDKPRDASAVQALVDALA